MMKLDPRVVMRLMSGLGTLMENALKIPKPDITDEYILTPEESKTEFHVVVVKAGFKKKEDAELFLKFNNDLDEML